ncbi:thiamine diphosphate-binding protein, partial [Suillus ampliporus]
MYYDAGVKLSIILLHATHSENRITREIVFILGEEVARYNGDHKVTKDHLDEFGEKRVVDIPITEIGFAGLAVGAALGGLRPQSIDQIVNSAGKVRWKPAAQHSQNYTSWYDSVPGLKVVSHWSAEECKGLLEAFITLIVFLENEMVYGVTFPMSSEAMSDNFVLPIGKTNFERQGSDLTIVALSKMVTHSIEAVDLLAKEVSSLLIVGGGFPAFSVGSEICAQIVESEAFDYVDAPVERITGVDVPTLMQLTSRYSHSLIHISSSKLCRVSY